MKPIKKKKIIIQEYWCCGVDGCETMHKNEKTALACIKKDDMKVKDKLLDKQREIYINSLILIGKLDELKLSDFLEKTSIRTRHCLRVLGEITVADFLKIPDKDLLKKRNFGKKGLFEIKKLISAIKTNHNI